MDLLFKRYASPFSFISTLLQAGRFSEFVDEFMKATGEDDMWEYFLHKVFDKSFDEFMKSTEPKEEMTAEQVETTIHNSQDILSNFIPEEGG